MELPLISDEFRFYKEAQTDEELFAKLSPSISDFVTFFCQVSEDQTWCEEHLQFSRLAADWLTKLSLQNNLDHQSLKLISEKIHEHNRFFIPLLPTNITFRVEDVKVSVNSLLFAAGSERFKDLIIREFRDQKKAEFSLPIPMNVFKVFKEFMEKGNVEDLWKRMEGELYEIRQHTTLWGLKTLGEQTESVLKRYIMRGNVFKILKESHIQGWLKLRSACYDFVGSMGTGSVFRESSTDQMILEFQEFKEASLEVFAHVKDLVTDLIVGGRLLSAPEFRFVLKESPHLKGLDLNHSYAFDDNLREAPRTLERLDISSCLWVSDANLRILFSLFPHLKKLTINSNDHLSYGAWGELQKLRALDSLDISRNSLSDEIFKMILTSCPQIHELDCNDCKNITEKGLLDITRITPVLAKLSLKRSAMTNGVLCELAQRCRFLKELDLTRCLQVSDKGVIECAKHARALQKLTISQCPVRMETIRQIQTMRPYLLLEYN